MGSAERHMRSCLHAGRRWSTGLEEQLATATAAPQGAHLVNPLPKKFAGVRDALAHMQSVLWVEVS